MSKHSWSCAALLLLAACGSVMPTPEPAAFLSDYARLAGAEGSMAARARLPVDPARAVVGEVRWRAASDQVASVAEQQALLAVLRRVLEQELRAGRPAPQGRAVVLRAAITRVEPVSPLLNTVSALALFVPLDRGGAAVEIEAVDAVTGAQLAALRLGYFAPLSDFKARFSRLAPVEIALNKAAQEFVALLQPGESGS